MSLVVSPPSPPNPFIFWVVSFTSKLHYNASINNYCTFISSLYPHSQLLFTFTCTHSLNSSHINMNPLSFPNCCFTSISCFDKKLKHERHYLLSHSILYIVVSTVLIFLILSVTQPYHLTRQVIYNFSPLSKSWPSWLHMTSLLIIQWLSKCGPLTSSISITWELKRSANSVGLLWLTKSETLGRSSNVF